MTVKVQKHQWVFVQMISSELLNRMLPNLIWWCIIMDQIVMQKDWFATFKVKVTRRLIQSNMTVSTMSTELLILSLPNLIGWYITISWSVFWKDWIAVVRARLQWRFKASMKFCQFCIFCTTDILVTKVVSRSIFNNQTKYKESGHILEVTLWLSIAGYTRWQALVYFSFFFCCCFCCCCLLWIANHAVLTVLLLAACW